MNRRQLLTRTIGGGAAMILPAAAKAAPDDDYIRVPLTWKEGISKHVPIPDHVEAWKGWHFEFRMAKPTDKLRRMSYVGFYGFSPDAYELGYAVGTTQRTEEAFDGLLDDCVVPALVQCLADGPEAAKFRLDKDLYPIVIETAKGWMVQPYPALVDRVVN